MREIKFRAWNGEKFIYFGLTSLIVDAVEGDVHELYSLLRTGNFEPDRYTGLKDKNGVEIYEGDIVRTDNDIQHFHTQLMPYHSYAVQYWDGAYCLFSVDDLNIDQLNIAETSSEVIGNIYENPELLEKN